MHISAGMWKILLKIGGEFPFSGRGLQATVKMLLAFMSMNIQLTLLSCTFAQNDALLNLMAYVFLCNVDEFVKTSNNKLNVIRANETSGINVNASTILNSYDMYHS